MIFNYYQTRYPESEPMGLFDIAIYGVPIAIAGTAYILLMSPILLPGAKNASEGTELGGRANILLGARLTPWSPASGRTVKRSGLRDTGGIYLVSVYRHETGRVHRAVGQDFGLNVGDILYFASGFPETFAEFCHEHGLEVVTNEVEDDINFDKSHSKQIEEEVDLDASPITNVEIQLQDAAPYSITFSHPRQNLNTIDENDETMLKVDYDAIGTTKESLALSDYSMKMRAINQLTDIVRGNPKFQSNTSSSRSNRLKSITETFGEHDAAKIIVVGENHQSGQKLVIIAVNTRDRSGLLHDISKGIVRLKLQCRSTEAAVIQKRSISIWRCEVLEGGTNDVEEVWSILNALLENETGIQAVKQRGIVVVRATVRKNSRLIGKTALESRFNDCYKAAIVAIRRGDKTPAGPMSKIKFMLGDILILQTKEDSPILVRPYPEFYDNESETASIKRNSSSFQSLVKRVRTSFGSQSDLEQLDKSSRSNSEVSLSASNTSRIGSRKNSFDLLSITAPVATETGVIDIEIGQNNMGHSFEIGITDESEINNNEENNVEMDIPNSPNTNPISPANDVPESQMAIWRDLQVAFFDDDEFGESLKSPDKREFLTAMQLKKRSQLAKKTAIQSGLDKLSGVFLVSIERIIEVDNDIDTGSIDAIDSMSDTAQSTISGKTEKMVEKLTSVAPDEQLMPGDILWFSGPASKIGDLRKIPGLTLYENNEVKKINAEIQDRRLVQAVVARKGPLVGKSVIDVKFRTRYGAAVISVHREGKRVHEHPGKVKLQAGDVLLLEAGPTFVHRNADTDRSFALLSEVENSAPPRLRLLVPALAITVCMLAVFTAGVSSLLVCALIASILMVLLGILSQQEVRDSLNWDVYITIASAFGIGTALTNSGIAGALAVFLVNLGEAVGKLHPLFLVCP